MSETRKSIHGQWSSRWIFIMAATGSAVGLGNVWKFPYIAGEYGGGAFVLIYLFCIALIGLPVMMAEIMLGRRGRQSPINTMRALAEEAGRSRLWGMLGWSGVVAGFLILSFYSVIAGWALAYVVRTATGTFAGQTADGVGAIFTELLSKPESLLAWHTIFMVMTGVVIAKGVRAGLENAVKILMPALFVLLIILVGYAMNTGAFMQAVTFLFSPDFSKITAEGILTAMGHAFFTLSLGMGAIMVYGSYIPKGTSIAWSSITISIADTLVALLAGLAIFPIVFANGLQPGAGPGLIFETLPIAFGQMPYGTLFGTLFFILLSFAAWTSAISLIEPAVAWLVENRGFRRGMATLIMSVATWLVGLLTIFSFNIWSDVHPLGFFAAFEGKTFFDLLDYLTANIMLPLGGLFIAIFVGWLMKTEHISEELKIGSGLRFKLWKTVLCYVTPIGVGIVFLQAIGIISIN